MLTMEYIDKLSESRLKYEKLAFEKARSDMQNINESDGEILMQISTLSDIDLLTYVQEEE